MSNLPQQDDMLSAADRERLERLAEQTAEAQPWVPEQAGDTLAGRVLRWETGHKRGEPKEQAAVLVLRSAEGDRAFYTWHAQARYKLIAPKEALGNDRTGESVPPASRLARVGDFVAIGYRGKSTMDDGNEAASYNRRDRTADRRPAEEPAGAVDRPFSRRAGGRLRRGRSPLRRARLGAGAARGQGAEGARLAADAARPRRRARRGQVGGLGHALEHGRRARLERPARPLVGPN